MYEAFYGLSEKPFSILPDPDLIYWGRTHRMAFSMLEFGVINNAGFTVITGEIGSGKTTLVRYLLRRLNPKINVGLISNTPHGRDELLRWIMMSLNQPFDGDYQVLVQAISQISVHAVRELEPHDTDHRRGPKLGVGSARRAADAVQYQCRQVSIPAAYSCRTATTSGFASFAAASAVCPARVVGFSSQAVGSGGRRAVHRTPAEGGRLTAQLFSPEACAAIARASHGIPRVINVLCDTALVYGFAISAKTITPELIREVINDKRDFGVFPLGESIEAR